MIIWNIYKEKVKVNFQLNRYEKDGLSYWKNILFANTIIFLLPFALIALIPAFFYGISNQMYLLLTVDLISIAMIAIIGFVPLLTLQTRKVLFIISAIFFSTSLLAFFGPMGPGLLFLLGISFFCTIIFKNQYAYVPAWVNLGICVLIALLISLNLLQWETQDYSALRWIALSSNLVFLSFLCSAMVPIIFNGLENSFLKEKKTSQELDCQKAELKKAMAELEEKNQELESFAFTASHDLQEPLRMVTSFMGQLQNKYKGQLDEKAHQYIHFAVDGAKRMRTIILDLLDFSRAGKSNDEIVEIDLNKIIEEVHNLQRQMIKETNAKILYQNLPIIKGHKTQMVQIFQNLIGNALKYKKEHVTPIIDINCKEGKKEWIISIRDNGIGIEEEYFEKIFIIFQRLHHKNEYSGTGMGLAIVKKIVENNGGKIWLKSNFGEGSTFFFTIPK
ncbi:MAG: GHKL domain-containing protein [Mongoliibacter sp.]|uniref:sensor histidine kinase n=1 Tax=Mongoliibacter sp. TaxID=2022438 RepID=UPI0012F3964B|nr:ATP-binding protein [Mongoliibacter sp.]TVP45837.1 MAG: GHKL domain-containing protein [Mongoliibacter sp.]